MKRISLLVALTVVSLGLESGCSDQGSPPNTILPGVYSGTYAIRQGQHTQRGVVTLTITEGSYQQRGHIQIPSPPTGDSQDFQESGTIKSENGTVFFNFGRERTLRATAFPAWSLDGPFAFEYAGGTLTLEQNQGVLFVYMMLLQKK